MVVVDMAVRQKDLAGGIANAFERVYPFDKLNLLDRICDLARSTQAMGRLQTGHAEFLHDSLPSLEPEWVGGHRIGQPVGEGAGDHHSRFAAFVFLTLEGWRWSVGVTLKSLVDVGVRPLAVSRSL
jgi:hypothetical protein